MLSLTDRKTIFITGASSEIGQAVCTLCLDAGHRVIAHCRVPRAELKALSESTKDLELFQFDFSDTASLEAELQARRDFFEQADILINLAAAFPQVTFENATSETILAALRVNLVPGVLLMQVMGPAMARRGWGRIVLGSSIGVKFGGGANSFTYSLSKHATEFIPSICKKWAHDGVLTNVVRIGVTDTANHKTVASKDMTARAALIPVGRLAQPDEIANTLCWLASAANSYITGQVITAAGGE